MNIAMEFTPKILMAALAVLLAAACVRAEENTVGALPEKVRVLEAPGIHNLFVVDDRVYSGSTPEGEKAFEALAKLGVKTIVSVDGARPDVEVARRHGMRYVHLPHGYDGIDRELQLQLAKAAEELPGPVYVHCHHGKHRGPTAAAIFCMSQGVWSNDAAARWLAAAGTSTNYAGLYRTVESFAPPSASELATVPNEFPEHARVSGLVDAMVEIDERWENLKAVQEAGYAAPAAHPDLVPANEAGLLREAYRETRRLGEAADHGESFLEQLEKSEAGANELEELLRRYVGDRSAAPVESLAKAFDQVAADCKSCHKRFRN